MNHNKTRHDRHFDTGCDTGCGTGRRSALVLAFSALLAWAPLSLAGPIEQVLAMDQASLVVGPARQRLISRHASEPMIPASTMKLVTALAAIERWGLSHHFTTEVLVDGNQRLWIKGSGDPYLVAEELDLLVQALKARGLNRVRGLGLDDGLYASDLRVPGRSRSNNPYDAPLSALAVNFNTVNLSIGQAGIRSGEPQTPLTATGRRMGAGLAGGKHRVNLGTRASALSYFGEVLTAKLQQAGIQVEGDVLMGSVPASANRLHLHANSRTLEQVLRSMLEYSNNFVANNLFLLLGEQAGQTSFAQAQRHMEDWARRKFGWRDFRIEDGAGLSRGNRLSGEQMIELLGALADYRQLLPEQDNEPRVRAKTGTLSAVSCYAGFVERPQGWVPFSLMINQAAPYDLRRRLAQALADTPTLARPAR
ncbi:D-alanyl-D-alanine carboxypeptidase/D-alanyl-D-alanine-endopeptidase [Thiorhodovibrio frisius]|uniref:D-alanyl-D-alanine carboxypeptidase (Penicillin-binding protein 4) n=1 Tax=Thiorhodovibrio frisius TaxID=631362 RepID=H8YY29_9GAMM|nr:D-alanyl-D-alanine carboxypeptidase [Thiorhodovibrio frisius]EIC23355.1 D-alanyl-D-alanine carboxypeptidase (penicillin-binding protein 4) [Thiorhodovibrio frisius]WPL23564.1 D-alanyl-D-alanine carboxypeptidase precursor [Thiorhodovibrio frisius]